MTPTENTNPSGDFDEQSNSAPRNDHFSADAFLQDLVSLSNYFKLSPPISLNVGGATVAGDLISEENYFKGIAETLKESFQHHEELAESLHKMVSAYVRELNADDFAERKEPKYIHLANVRTFAAGRPQFAVRSKFWRGRIAEVGGLSYGYPPAPAEK
jgi:hypothetical protein